jgi:hypothetical protein
MRTGKSVSSFPYSWKTDAFQGRTLISASDWTIKDGSYDYETMFNNIVLLFEADPTDPWAVETLEWLTKYGLPSLLI